eukprot:7740195-Alexandrium_andersonii.AAC.1
MVRLDPQGDGFKHETEKCVRGVESMTLGKNVKGFTPQVTFVIADYNFVLELKPYLHIIGFQ